MCGPGEPAAWVAAWRSVVPFPAVRCPRQRRRGPHTRRPGPAKMFPSGQEKKEHRRSRSQNPLAAAGERSVAGPGERSESLVAGPKEQAQADKPGIRTPADPGTTRSANPDPAHTGVAIQASAVTLRRPGHRTRDHAHRTVFRPGSGMGPPVTATPSPPRDGSGRVLVFHTGRGPSTGSAVTSAVVLIGVRLTGGGGFGSGAAGVCPVRWCRRWRPARVESHRCRRSGRRRPAR